MEEYNLANDNASYSQALEAYQNDIIKKGDLQAENDREHDEAHAAWSEPLNVVGGTIATKPIAKFVKGKLQNLVQKGVKKGEQIVQDRAEELAKKAGQKLRDAVGDKLFKGGERPFPGTQSSLEDAYDGTKDLNISQGLRDSYARLRNLTGGRPLGSGGDPVELSDIKPPSGLGDAPTPWQPDLLGDLPKSSIPDDAYKVVNIGDENAGITGLSSEQEDAVNDILSGKSPEQALFRYNMRTMDVPTASSRAGIGDPSQPSDSFSQAQRFASRQKELGLDNNPSSSGDAGVVTEEPTPPSNSGNTADNLTDDVEDVSKVASKVGTGVTEGLEGAEVGADATALAEGGLNPFADLAALAVGIATLVGANAPDPDGKVAYTPVNPTITHGI